MKDFRKYAAALLALAIICMALAGCAVTEPAGPTETLRPIEDIKSGDDTPAIETVTPAPTEAPEETPEPETEPTPEPVDAVIPTPTELAYACEGTWTCDEENLFICLKNEDGKAYFMSAVWNAGLGRGFGEITDVISTLEINVFKLVVDYPFVPATEMDWAYDAETIEIILDTNDLANGSLAVNYGNESYVYYYDNARQFGTADTVNYDIAEMLVTGAGWVDANGSGYTFNADGMGQVLVNNQPEMPFSWAYEPDNGEWGSIVFDSQEVSSAMLFMCTDCFCFDFGNEYLEFLTPRNDEIRYMLGSDAENFLKGPWESYAEETSFFFGDDFTGNYANGYGSETFTWHASGSWLWCLYDNDPEGLYREVYIITDFMADTFSTEVEGYAVDYVRVPDYFG